MSRLASRSPAAPFQTSRPAPMTPGQQQRKDAQDEARRQQHADERIRELEIALLEVMDYIEGRQNGPMSSDIDPDEIWEIANRALDGGGDGNE